MDLIIENKSFLVCGAASGFGRAIAEALIIEGAKVIVTARRKAELEKIASLAPDRVQIIVADLFKEEDQDNLLNQIDLNSLSGAVINAGGPPAKSFLETEMDDWDNAYSTLVRWKVRLTKKILPALIANNYGRLVFVESKSVKQPVENLVLSNAMRMAVVGMVKTLSQEVAHYGITMNIMAPGYHDTPAMQRIFEKKASIKKISIAEARKSIESEIAMGKMGDPKDFAQMALLLLSPSSNFINGQTISVEGGLIKGVFG
ncbi:MAG: SDR family oxidoreductase [Bacteroidales bacterium]|nr:SDR family oxidoreductase [Bacteroidales bacterium]